MQSTPKWCKFNFALKASVAIGAISISYCNANAQTVVVPSATMGDSTDSDGSGDATGDILVTGSHIVGAESASPMLKITADEIRMAGQLDIGETLRSLPFNFNGGQNPGVLVGSSGGNVANQNITGGSTPNLRGLGPDATLTLLNGHRTTYSGFVQGVDVSSIPLAAVSSVEVVLDGASALYGSDAVAGVVNVILKKDYDGLAADVTIGGPTDGGGFLQQYALTGGSKWATGGFIISGQHQRRNNIKNNDRDYTSYMNDPGDIGNRYTQNSFVFAGHQEIARSVTFSLDAMYSHREMYEIDSPASTTIRYDFRTRDESFEVTPSLDFDLGGNWAASVDGTYAQDEAKQRHGYYRLPSGATTYSNLCDCNRSESVELNASGPLFTIAGGAVKLAAGGGYRRNEYHSRNLDTGTDAGGSRASYFGYGELNIPIFSASNGLAWLRQLTFSSAARYEHNEGFGNVVTPKLGLIYAPSKDLDLHITWGRSFKAPTLTQQFYTYTVYLDPAAWYGWAGRNDATVLFKYGGNPSLKAEKSENWSATVNLHPTWLDGFRASVTYYNIRYTNRVLQPNLSNALGSDLASAPYVTLNPDPTAQAAIIAGTEHFIPEIDGAYNPSNVVAVLDQLYTNVARQKIRGIDVTASYNFTLGGGSLGLFGNASWLKSEQLNSDLTPIITLAGRIYNPPSFRGRGGASYAKGVLRTSVYLNYIGGVLDDRLQPGVDGQPMVTADWSFEYNVAGQRDQRRSLLLAVTVQNMTNERAPYLRPVGNSYPPYDATNYSSLGRFISGSIRVRW